ncbi:alpha/beta fold hydrolase [Zhongshania sp.]|uniref:alpha/beta fold hydrolase n=1 Tax=Zhongshania sp. TaxID=1971902 RepID=UPI0039E52A25
MVLLHGFGSSRENWSYLAAKLRRDHFLLIPDLAGFGDSAASSSAYLWHDVKFRYCRCNEPSQAGK